MVFALVVVPLLLLYATSASWTSGVDQDTFTNIVSAHAVGTTGGVVVDDAYTGLVETEFLYPDWWNRVGVGRVAWFVEGPRGTLSKYPPGVAVVGAPFYRAVSGTSDVQFVREDGTGAVTVPAPSMAPGTAAAVVSSALAMGLLAVAIAPTIGSRAAVVVGLIAGSATSVWSIASDQLWQHGPALLFIGAMFVVGATGRWFAIPALVLTRPLGVVIAAVVGKVRPQGSGWRKLATLALPPAVGLLALIGYNWFFFGAPTVLGGYAFAADPPLQQGPDSVLANAVTAFFGLRVGIFVWSPFLLACIAGLPEGWREAPAWVRTAAIGGFAYLVAQVVVISADPGVSPYRYPLEGLMAMAPLLAVSAATWVRTPSWRRWVLGGSVGLSVFMQAVAAYA